MIPVWLIAAIALLGAVCLALPLHIGMTGVCLLLLAAVLLALRILKKKDAPRPRISSGVRRPRPASRPNTYAPTGREARRR